MTIFEADSHWNNKKRLDMKSLFSIDLCRGSIFAPTVAYNESVWQKLSKEFNGYLPSNNNAPAINLQGNLIQIGGPMWSLSSKEDRLEINFLEGKIDVILKKGNQLYSYEAIQESCMTISSTFEKIINAIGLVSTRLAFAPSLISHQKTSLEIKNFARSIFKEKIFKGASIDNCDFSNLFRINTSILDKEVVVNYLAIFSLAQMPILQQSKIKMQDVLQINIDINTLGNEEYKFNVNDVKEFFNQSPSMTTEFLDFYFGGE